jgi:hypothetical protein
VCRESQLHCWRRVAVSRPVNAWAYFPPREPVRPRSSVR